jgi:hypothetical protein
MTLTQIKLLILTANPRDTDVLRLGEEVRNIELELERYRHQAHFQVISKWAVRVDDLASALLDYEPHIVQFSGHGTGKDGLVLEDNDGKLQLVTTEALSRLFRQVRNSVKCVFLNACYSKLQAEAIHQHIDCVVGMTRAIGDKAAIQFATKFYQALAMGKSFPGAFEFAATVLDLSGSNESTTPALLTRNEDEDPFSLIADSPVSPSESMHKHPPSDGPRPGQSQTIGNITISGNSNAFTNVQAGNDVTLDQSQGSTQSQTSDLEAALTAIAELKQAIATTDALNRVEKATAEVPVSMLEDELQKPQPDKGLIDQAIEALQTGLNGVVTLAGPVTQVATLVAKAWVGLP